METLDSQCGDPTCACATLDTEFVEPAVSETADLVDDVLDRVDAATTDAIAEAYYRGKSDGAREALDSVSVLAAYNDEIENGEDLPDEATETVNLLGEFVLALSDKLDTWAPIVDANINYLVERDEATTEVFEALAAWVIAAEEYLASFAEAVADIAEGQDEMIEDLQERVFELEADTAGDAALLDAQNLTLQTVLARLDRVEDVTGARRFVLNGSF